MPFPLKYYSIHIKDLWKLFMLLYLTCFEYLHYICRHHISKQIKNLKFFNFWDRNINLFVFCVVSFFLELNSLSTQTETCKCIGKSICPEMTQILGWSSGSWPLKVSFLLKSRSQLMIISLILSKYGFI